MPLAWEVNQRCRFGTRFGQGPRIRHFLPTLLQKTRKAQREHRFIHKGRLNKQLLDGELQRLDLRLQLAALVRGHGG